VGARSGRAPSRSVKMPLSSPAWCVARAEQNARQWASSPVLAGSSRPSYSHSRAS
jgi:hypothetical protein